MLASANGVDYYYDAEDNRVGKSGSGATDIIYFGGQAMARLTSGSWTDLVYGARGLLAEVTSSTVIYRMINRLDSAVGALSSTGGSLGTQDYAPFGELFNGSGVADPYKFTGRVPPVPMTLPNPAGAGPGPSHLGTGDGSVRNSLFIICLIRAIVGR